MDWNCELDSAPHSVRVGHRPQPQARLTRPQPQPQLKARPGKFVPGRQMEFYDMLVRGRLIAISLWEEGGLF